MFAMSKHSMVCFEEGVPKMSEYRKFKIRTVSGAPDDFASMREVVSRRYRRVLEEGGELPDLVLIDGRAELGLGEQAVASLAKREEEIFTPGREDSIRLPRHSPVLQLVQRLRDEAHRFAVGYHRKARTMRTLRSEVDDIAGVGPITRRKLLSRFGSVRGVRSATPQELEAVVGPKVAAKIRAHFDGEAAR